MDSEFFYQLAKEDAGRMYFNYPGMNTVWQNNYRKLNFFFVEVYLLSYKIVKMQCSSLYCSSLFHKDQQHPWFTF